MRIVIGGLTYPLANGVTVSIDQSIDGLVGRGHEVKVVAPKYQMGQTRKEHVPVAASRLLELVTYTLGNKERFFGVKAAPAIRLLLKTFNPDVMWLHTVTWVPNTFELLMLREKRPTVLTYHTLVEVYGRTYAGEVGARHMRRRTRELANSVGHVIAPSEAVEQYLRTIGVESPITVIPTGVGVGGERRGRGNALLSYGANDNGVRLLFVGRVVKEKNIDFLFHVMRSILLQNPNTQLFIVGSGQLDDYRRRAEELGLGRAIIFTGALPHSEIASICRSADLFVFPSQTETQGIVLAEALSTGLPAIVFDVPCFQELNASGGTFVAHTEEEFIALAKKVINNPELLQVSGEQGRRYVQQYFSIEHMLDKQEEVLESVARFAHVR